MLLHVGDFRDFPAGGIVHRTQLHRTVITTLRRAHAVMNLRSHAGMGILMTALASAAMAAPASAAEAPVVVPLQGLEPVIPMDAPTVATGVPLPVPGTPTVFHGGTPRPCRTSACHGCRSPARSRTPSSPPRSPRPSRAADRARLG